MQCSNQTLWDIQHESSTWSAGIKCIYFFDRLPDEPSQTIFIVSVLDLIWLSHQGTPNRDYRASQKISYALKQPSFHASTCRVTLMNAEWLRVNVIFTPIWSILHPFVLIQRRSHPPFTPVSHFSCLLRHEWVNFEGRERVAAAARMNSLNAGNETTYCLASHSSMLWHDKGSRTKVMHILILSIFQRQSVLRELISCLNVGYFLL